MKEPKNQGKKWTSNDISELKKLSEGNTPTGLIAHKLGRSEDSVRNKAKENNISLKPTNQSPYDRKVSNSSKAKK
jgi:hypothetical protein